MGQALDVLYQYGLEKLYPQLAGLTVKRLDLACWFTHMDSSGFHVDDQYNSREEAEEGVVHINKGYSRCTQKFACEADARKGPWSRIHHLFLIRQFFIPLTEAPRKSLKITLKSLCLCASVRII